MHCTLVSHTHWDREWYRTFQSFRARLVDTIDRVLDLIQADEGYHFLLDGQAIVLEDYFEIRPERRPELEAACREGRVAIGPWYVQPDSLLPSGEAHIRNLLEGRRVANTIGTASRVAYTPDSFGHPAQFPQLFSGFGLGPFIYWRGNGNELDDLPAEYCWVAPDGSSVLACLLTKGYFAACGLSADVGAAVDRLRQLATDLAERTAGDRVLLMNGVDHMLPDPHTREVAEALAKSTGWTVERGLLEDFVRGLEEDAPEYRGELLGGRIANLLPGVWSTRIPLKLRNRACEAELEGWAEPWAALAQQLGASDERAALRTAWRSLLPNQAHDSICGCSQDRVHEQMIYRYDAAQELAHETTQRALERIAGLGAERQLSGAETLEIAVFNPSPHVRTDRVRFALDGFPAITSRGVNAMLAANRGARGFTVGGEPARLIAHAANVRPRFVPDEPVWDLEFIARDVPAFGWRRFELRASEEASEIHDSEREIRSGDIVVCVEDGGTLGVQFGERRFTGLAALEDVGDRGDTYDFDPVAGAVTSKSIDVRRASYLNGVQELYVKHVLSLPRSLAEDRESRSAELVDLPVHIVVRLTPGVERVDIEIELDNTACDHRLRMLFPTAGEGCARAATTFGVSERRAGHVPDENWIHPAPSTFPHQGWLANNDLMLVAPGLPEGEVLEDGSLAVTLLRSVGWLSRPDLRSRPGEAGPALPTPGAQCLGRVSMTLALLPGMDPRAARDAELGLRAVAAGDDVLAPEDEPLLAVEPRALLVSAVKPADAGGGVVLRLLNPTSEELEARIVLGFPVREAIAVRLDETRENLPVQLRGHRLECSVAPHALRSILLRA